MHEDRHRGEWRLGAALAPLACGLLLLGTPAWGAATRQQDPRGALVLLLFLPLIVSVFTALELVLWVLVPSPLIATVHALEQGRGRCLLLGLIVSLLAFVLLALSGQHPQLSRWIGPLVLGFLGLGVLTGVTAVAMLLGQGVIDLAGRSGSRLLAAVTGSVLLCLVVLFPLVGQVLGVYFLLVGLGGALRAMAHSLRGSK